jgi:hypothetical protein
MKITKNLPHFSNPTLVLVSGKQEAFLYFAYKDKITKKDNVKVKNVKFSDHEDFYISRGKESEMLRLGYTNEYDDTLLREEMFKELNKAIDEFSDDYKFEQIIIFCPQYIIKEFIDSLPKKYSDKITKKVRGNYTKQHIFELLELLKPAKKKIPIGKEVRKLLKKKKY